jgi:hypothetical protein
MAASDKYHSVNILSVQKEVFVHINNVSTQARAE